MDLIQNGVQKIEIGHRLENDILEFLYDICGVIILFLQGDKFNNSILNLFKESYKCGNKKKVIELLDSVLISINEIDRSVIAKIYDMGTRPTRFLSANQLFYNEQIQEIVDHFFKNNSHTPILVKPFNGETLHVIPPGEENFRFNLPIHQDFPYLLQSEKQLTFWLNLTKSNKQDQGGIRVYPDTHKYGIPYTKKDDHGHYEVDIASYPEFDESKYIDSESSQFELYAIDSLTWHASRRNISPEGVRMTYIFRISDVSDKYAINYGQDGLMDSQKKFEDIYTELYVG